MSVQGEWEEKERGGKEWAMKGGCLMKHNEEDLGREKWEVIQETPGSLIKEANL